jgi:pantothenate kinase
MSQPPPKAGLQSISLCEALDRILNKGAVVAAEVTISVANIELVYLSLQALVTSVETARQLQEKSQRHALQIARERSAQQSPQPPNQEAPDHA